MLAITPLNNMSIIITVNRENPSFVMLDWTMSNAPDQFKSSLHPKERFCHPAGTTASIISGLTLWMAITPTATEAIVIIANCSTSVRTTLYMPPLTT